MTDLLQDLIKLFEQTGKAHHKAFIETDGADDEWPLWYADYLKDKLSKKLGASFTKSELVYMLIVADRERASEAPGAPWPRYYANFFIDRYMP